MDLTHVSVPLPHLLLNSISCIFYRCRKGKGRFVQYAFFYCSDRQLRKHAIRFRIHIMNDLEYELHRIIEGDIRFDKLSRLLYSTDASMYQVEPIGVVIPRHTDDIQAVLELCNRRNVPVLPRGGGTSLTGQTVNYALVLEDRKSTR